MTFIVISEVSTHVVVVVDVVVIRGGISPCEPAVASWYFPL